MKKLFVCVATLLVACSLSATVHKVKASDGAEVLKSTIAEAAAGDTVLVQAGTFTGNFTMKDGVQVIGGWDETFTSKKDYATILDANADGRVLNQAADFATMTIWENFTIQNGNDETTTGGGGVWLAEYGQVKHCLIQNNKTKGYGGGVGNNNTSASLHGNIMIDECIIKNNYSELQGGGCRIGRTIRNSIIEYNQSKKDAGGVYLQHGRMENCIVRLNKQLGGDAGGVRAYGNIEVVNNLIYGNVASSRCGGLSYGCKGATALIANNVVICNQQLNTTQNVDRCGVCGGSDVTPNVKIANNIIWGNKVGDEVGSTQTSYMTKEKISGANSLMNNAVYNAAIGDGGINLGAENPGFKDITNADTTKWDLSLLPDCSLIDAGYDSIFYGKAFDGSNRIKGLHIDLGAYETICKHVYVGQDLQKVIDDAAKGDTLLVQAGTFTGNFTMKEGVNVSGGWNADFTEQTDYTTILDGDAKGRVLNQKAAFAVSTIWENLTIQNGGATEALGDKGGFGVYLRGNGGLRHCLVQNNKFTGATGESNGGGVRVDGADAKFVALEDCWIKGNQGTHAGGVCLGKGTMINCLVEENTTTNNATGGVTVQDGSFLLNSIIRNNNPKGDFGGVRMRSTTPSTVANCLIYGNVAGTEDAKKTVGGIGINDGVHYLYNNTIVGNIQTSTSNVSRCGLRINVGAGAVIANNIVWGNIAGTEVQADQVEINGNYKSGQAENFINNAVVIPADFGTNTILLNAENPGFFAPESGDYTLADGSALIDAGADAYAQGKIDLAGNARIQGKAIDLGAYEAEVIKLTVAAYENAVATMNDDTIAAGDYYVAKGKEVIFAVTADEGYYIEVAKLNNDTIGENCEAFTAPETLTEDATLTIVTKKQSGTALINAKANTDATKAKKVIVNGQLVVVKDNARYNVLGVKL